MVNEKKLAQLMVGQIDSAVLAQAEVTTRKLLTTINEINFEGEVEEKMAEWILCRVVWQLSGQTEGDRNLKE